MVRNGPKRSKRSKMVQKVQNGPNGPNSPKWSKRSKMVKTVQNGPMMIINAKKAISGGSKISTYFFTRNVPYVNVFSGRPSLMPRLALFRLQGAAFKTSGIEFSFRSSANHILVLLYISVDKYFKTAETYILNCSLY